MVVKGHAVEGVLSLVEQNLETFLRHSVVVSVANPDFSPQT